MKRTFRAVTLQSPSDGQCLPEDVPAHVRYLDDKRAAVSHPAGYYHANAIETRNRLRNRGYLIVDPPNGTDP